MRSVCLFFIVIMLSAVVAALNEVSSAITAQTRTLNAMHADWMKVMATSGTVER